MSIHYLMYNSEFKELLDSNKVFVVLFTADWCGPCHAISPLWHEQAASMPEMEFYEVDVDGQHDIAKECGVTAMPTFMVFKDGKKIDEMHGAIPPELRTLLKKAAAL